MAGGGGEGGGGDGGGGAGDADGGGGEGGGGDGGGGDGGGGDGGGGLGEKTCPIVLPCSSMVCPMFIHDAQMRKPRIEPPKKSPVSVRPTQKLALASCGEDGVVSVTTSLKSMKIWRVRPSYVTAM